MKQYQISDEAQNTEECPVRIEIERVVLQGGLCVPQKAMGIVLFAHGSGSSRKSPRNQYVARVLREAKLGTLLFDLLTEKEEAEEMYTGHRRFDINLLAGRLEGVTQWVRKNSETSNLDIGYFGASTGAAAAIIAAAKLSEYVKAVVSRGGRPDLAEDYLDRIKASTLLIVGGRDYEVITLNRIALEKIKSEKEMVIVPGATHLFEEPGALERVAKLAEDWFVKYF